MSTGIKVHMSACRGCARCIKVCPTEAMRVEEGRVRILEELCVDCGECIRTCEDRAILINEDNWRLLASQDLTVIIADPAFYAQTRNYGRPDELKGKLREVGLEDIVEFTSLSYDLAAYSIAREIDKRGPESLPLISTYCPAVIRLIQINYPELVGRFVPVESPLETAVDLWRLKTGRKDDITLVSPCPAKVSLVRAPEAREESSIRYAVSIQNVVKDLLAGGIDGDSTPGQSNDELRYLLWSLRGGEASHVDAFCDKKIRSISVSGLRNTIDLLNELELGRLEGVDYIECRACNLGCIGGVGNLESRFLTHLRLDQMHIDWDIDDSLKSQLEELYQSNIWRLQNPLKARQRIPLDSDLKQAMARLREMNQIYAELPHIDCASCGRPSCKALAEDIVRGYGDTKDCVFKLREEILRLSEELSSLASRAPHAFNRKR